jgi:FdhD protein
MHESYNYEGYKFEKGSVTKVTDPLTVESPLQITINDEPFTVVMQTPGAEKELATGLLYAEDVISDFTKVSWEVVKDDYGRIENLKLTIDPIHLGDGFMSSRSLLSVSSCGICGKKELGDLIPKEVALKTKYSIKASDLHKMFSTMRDKQELFEITGGCHGIAAFDINNELICIREDIGRHNALDKVIGNLLQNGSLVDAKIVTFSGRTSYEMVSKAFRAKIPIIASVSAPSSLAIDFAKEFGLTLIGFSRGDKFTCYSGTERIIQQ